MGSKSAANAGSTTRFLKWCRKWSCGMILFSVAAISTAAERAGAPELLFSPEKSSGEKFLKEVSSLVDSLIDGLALKDSKKWEGLCEPSGGFLFRYLGEYETKLSCGEFLGLFRETKKRWWGRHDGSGEPILGTFQKIWYARLKDVALKHEKAGVNVFVHSGNAVDRPMGKAPFIDWTWSGPKKYGDMGWESVRLFFEKKNGKWFLKGLDIYHWTI